ncbi:MAG: GlsB/YeaQ/YmgE family stress response membrane protein [Actinomycetes bacterium]|jgi:uncharacterized membrane protein YeaQ/YmgE (transglycosylase-associated protein family)|uniref:Unannotated protein n=1 Tax=freshwater metagenome TaxID=449393 RepID=A0A6J6EDP9_9ZZZZ|nr:GlsB/YeaQ/YmgE family stress response membrane protein [Actinomycetota bacterium]
MDLLAWVIVGLIAGGVARWIVKDERNGCLYTISVGVIGALIGGGLMRGAGIDNDDAELFASIGTAIVGAVLLLLVLQALDGRMQRRRRPWDR